jgi:hypothetical protein
MDFKKKHVCGECNFTTSRKFNLNRHYQRKHQNQTVHGGQAQVFYHQPVQAHQALKQQQGGNHHAQVGRGVGQLHRPWEHHSSVQAQRPITSQILSYVQGYPQLQPVQHGQVVHQQPPHHGE